MSHRALVISPSGAGGLDVYSSQNGAFELKLYPVLNEWVSVHGPSVPTDLDDIPDAVTDQVTDLRADFGEPTEKTSLIDSEPLKTDVPRAELGDVVDYVRYEAVYLINEPRRGEPRSQPPVEVFIPVFIDVGLGLFFIRFVDLDIYSKGGLPENHEKALSRIREGKVEPEYHVSGLDYLELPENPHAFEHFVEAHQGVLQTLYGIVHSSTGDETVTVIVTESHYVVGTVDTSSEVPLPNPRGKGCLVRLPVEDLPYQSLVSLYSDWRHLSNRLRATHSLKTALKIFSALEEGDSPTEVGSDQVDDLLTSLIDEFGSSISPYSPEDYSPPES